MPKQGGVVGAKVVSMKFRNNICYYIVRSTLDSSCLRLAFILGLISFVFLIVFYIFPSLRVPVLWREDKITSINNLMVTLSSGYLITYISYFLTITIPFAVKLRYKRAGISENARSLKDRTYDFLNGICDFCNGQDVVREENLKRFLELNCYIDLTHKKVQLKSDGKRYINGFIEELNYIQRQLEKNVDYLFSTERKCLTDLENAKMWKIIKQLFYGVLFTKGQCMDLLNEILYYHKLANQLFRSLEDDKYRAIEEKDIDHTKKSQFKRIFSFISIININYNH